jgi:HAL2 family 3'(2'),5'-bisphosphate nucleotidase
MLSYEAERATAVEAARLAGGLCMAIRNEMLAAPRAMEKQGREPVTIADYGAQALVLRAITRRFPGDATLAEERAAEFKRLAGPEAQKAVVRHVGAALGADVSLADVVVWLDAGRDAASDRVWLVDPIDGTQGFVRGDQFAVAVGLLVDGEPVVGALACPASPFEDDAEKRGAFLNGRTAEPFSPLGLVISAERGEGATVAAFSGGDARPARVSGREAGADVRTLESVEKAHHDHAFSAAVMERADVRGEVVRIDSQAKYAAVADGRAEVYIRHSQGGRVERAWDHAAGALIVEEAGGRVTDLDGKPLDFTHGATLAANRGVLATNGLVHDRLLAAIRAVEGRA